MRRLLLAATLTLLPALACAQTQPQFEPFLNNAAGGGGGTGMLTNGSNATSNAFGNLVTAATAATARSALGLGTGDSPTFTGLTLSATGGTSQFLKQATLGAAITSAQPTFADIASGSTAATATGMTISGGTLSGTTTLPGNGQITSGGSITIGNTQSYKINNSSGTAIGILSVDGANVTRLNGSAGNLFIHADENQTTYMNYNNTSDVQIGDGSHATRLFVSNGNLQVNGLIQIAGITSSFPCAKRSSTTWQHRLCDDSADGPMSASTGTFSAVAPTVSAGQIGFGGTVAATGNCGTLVGDAGCIVVNVAGTTRYIPYY